MFPMLGVRWTLLLKSGRFCRGGTRKMVVEKDQEGTRTQISIRQSRNTFSFFFFSMNTIERRKGRREERRKEGIQTQSRESKTK